MKKKTALFVHQSMSESGQIYSCNIQLLQSALQYLDTFWNFNLEFSIIKSISDAHLLPFTILSPPPH